MLTRFWKPILGTILVLLALALIVWFFVDGQRQRELAAQTVTEYQTKLIEADTRAGEIQKHLNDANRKVVELEARKPGERVVIKNIPADCVECFRNHRIRARIESKDKLLVCETEDVLGEEPGTFTVSPKYVEALTGPYRKVAEDCQGDLKKCLEKRPPFLNLDLQTDLSVGIGTDYRVSGRFAPLGIGGRRFQVRPFLEAGVALNRVQTLEGWAVAGVALRIGR